MKRAIMLTIAALFVLAVGVSADTATSTVLPGWNLLSASLVPTTSTGYGIADARDVFKTDLGTSITISNRLYKWEAPSLKPWTTLGAGTFGKILLGNGYFLSNTTGASIVWQYPGVANGVPDGTGKKTDMWVSLPSSGYNLIGHPFTDAILWSGCQMTDGTTTKSVNDAKLAGWFDGFAVWYDTAAKSYKNVVISGIGEKYLRGYRGYWIKTNVNNLALIIPALP